MMSAVEYCVEVVFGGKSLACTISSYSSTAKKDIVACVGGRRRTQKKDADTMATVTQESTCLSV